jgi:hypothetical protein
MTETLEDRAEIRREIGPSRLKQSTNPPLGQDTLLLNTSRIRTASEIVLPAVKRVTDGETSMYVSD